MYELDWKGQTVFFCKQCVELWFSIIVNLLTEYIKLSLITGQMGSLQV
jgi:hypothetical protein